MAQSNKKLKKWSTQELVTWIGSIGLAEKWQATIVEAIEGNGVTGQDFAAIKDAKEIGESFNIKNPMLCKRVFNALKKQLEQERDAAINQATAQFSAVTISVSRQQPQNHYNKSNNFELQLFGQHKYWKVHELVNQNTKVQYVKELYKRESGVSTPVDDIVLYSKGKQLNGNKTLGEIGITDEKHLITVMFKANGGSDSEEEEKERNRERVIRFGKYNLKKSSQADCLIGYDDDDYIDRAEIGCPRKHAMAAVTMYNYIVQVLEKNVKSVTIPCPHCQVALDWDTCTRIADMNGREYAQWTRVMEQRLEGETKTCPHCQGGMKRKQGVIIFRMRCPACNGPDWCWNCTKRWNGSGSIVCGNNECTLIKNTNEILRNAPKKTPEYLNKVTIPSIRACPKCLTFMEHKDRCKHMKCIGCTEEFCFVCLGVKDKEKGWPCNNHTYECPAAPVQVFK